MNETYLIFILQGYEQATETGGLTDVATVELIDTSSKNALKRAKTILKKKFWRITSVIEKESK